YQCATILSVLLLAAGARADQITLSNGDRVTGSIITSDADSVTVKTEVMGEVKIQRSGIASITAGDPLNVTLADGETVLGTIATEQQDLRVRREDASEVTEPLAGEWTIRNDESQRSWEREQERQTNPGWGDFWAGDVNFGLASARGNSRTTTLSTGANAQRVTGFDKIKLT
ncbi:MAG: hypothetical protein GY953_16340, partial [bacterium]|nr:hypothetical protein [bacterium]